MSVLGCSLPEDLFSLGRKYQPKVRSGLLAIVLTAIALTAVSAEQQENTGGASGTAAAAAGQVRGEPSRAGDAVPDQNVGIAPNPNVAIAPGARVDADDKRTDEKQKPKRRTGKYDLTKIGQRGIGGGLNLYSLEKERAMGRDLAMQVERDARLITDPIITEYVNRVGQNIVRNSDARVPFIIKVIDDDQINAFALPGGFFYVNSGLILAAENEAELAGVMAHEIAHVAARHATKNATKAEIFNLASIPLIFFGGPAGYAVRQVAGFAVPMSFLKFSRDAEREADLLGLEYQYAAGYDPAEFVSFFETIRAKDKEKRNIIAKAFATHPMTDDRIKRAQKEIETMLPPRDQYLVNTSEFDEVRSRLAALVNQGKLNGANGASDRPTLRRRGPEQISRDKDNTENDDQDRPTLKRR